MSSVNAPRKPNERDYDVVIVGAGFAGMYMLHKVRELGLSARVYEAGDGVGGTWYWNRYPGARVDIEAREYSYSFSKELEDEWRWSERYAAQPELLRYADHVAERFDLKRDIQFETRVTAMRFDEASDLWTVKTDQGDEVSARFCVMATGCLSVPKDIDIPGIDSFQGEVYRTSLWPKEGVDFTGKRVAVIGTGSSGIQSIPEIGRQAAHLTVFQRTPNFSLPSQNAPMSAAMVDEWFADRDGLRQKQKEEGYALFGNPTASALAASEEERRQSFDAAWQEGGFTLCRTYVDFLSDKRANDTVADYIRGKIRAIVKDPDKAEKLAPTSHPFLTKRPCVDTGYYDTFNQDHVDLVDLHENPIDTVTAKGIRAGGKEREFDAIVLAIGFDAMTGALCAIDIEGRDGARLKDQWTREPKAYLGLAIAGFPNMFTVTGPGSPSVLANMIVAIEQHVDWIAGCIGDLRDSQASRIEASREAQDAWMDHVNTVADMTLYPLADSWYTGANVPGKARVFPIYAGLWSDYRTKCLDVAANDYQGFKVARVNEEA